MGARGKSFSRAEGEFMRRTLALAERGYGGTSPNPMVGAVLVRNGEIIGEGWHKRAGEAHAEVNAIAAARRNVSHLHGASLFVTLEPCSTTGRTGACTGAILESGIAEVIVAARDPNPEHSGKGFSLLRKAGVRVRTGLLEAEANRLNEAFNHWIVRRSPWVVLKCAMSLDGKIATNSGESKWITGEKARGTGMKLRLGADAILVGINTVLRDDPALTLRPAPGLKIPAWKRVKRIVLDPEARISKAARVIAEEQAAETIVVVTRRAPKERIALLGKVVRVLVAPTLRDGRRINLRWLLEKLGSEEITSVLVEGGGETHANFFRQDLVRRAYFFYASLIITGRRAPKAVGGARTMRPPFKLKEVEWNKVGGDLLCSGLVGR